MFTHESHVCKIGILKGLYLLEMSLVAVWTEKNSQIQLQYTMIFWRQKTCDTAACCLIQLWALCDLCMLIILLVDKIEWVNPVSSSPYRGNMHLHQSYVHSVSSRKVHIRYYVKVFSVLSDFWDNDLCSMFAWEKFSKSERHSLRRARRQEIQDWPEG